MIDLTEAVEAAAREHLLAAAQRRDYRLPLEWDALDLIQQQAIREHVLPYVTAAAPVIAEQIARAIEAEAKRDVPCWKNLTGRAAAEDSYETAARTARKWATR